MPVYRGPGGAGDATNDATVTAVQSAATAAATSATAAANSATAAANSATGASTSATNASNSATTAAGSVATATTQATNAATSASTAATQAGIATTQATNAASSASAASTSATNASNSASAAATSATNAGTSATNSAASAASALAIFGDATDVANAVTAAQLAETNAETAETNAETAATTATNAASTATTQASNAAASALAADADATAASIDANEAQAAATAAQAAVNSATAIYGSIEDIQQAEVNSEANRDAAAASATSASNSASTATTQAGIATTQATNAATSAAQASAVALGNEPVRHSVRPSLLLDFANTKTLDPRITYTRASAGTYYDGKTVALAEQNLLLQSQFASGWTASSTAISINSATAPDGNTTAATLTADGASASHVIFQTTVNYPTQTFSVFAKAGTNNFIQLRTSGDTQSFANFDITAGAPAVGSKGSSVPSSSITSVGNNWYRCVMTIVSSGANTAVIGIVASSTSVFNETNSLSTTVFVWGAQLEQRSSVTAYTATTTAPITNYVPVLLSAPANVARFEHNPTTGESLGLEIEEQRTNLVIYSDQFDNAAWGKFDATVTANTVVAPDGTLTSDKIVENTASAQHFVQQSIPSLTGTFTATVYAKAGGRTLFELGERTSIGSRAIFNLANGTIALQTASPNATITPVGNGWYRCSITPSALSSNTFGYRIQLNTTVTSADSYTGNGFDGIFIWGAQLEAGAFATSYIPTTVSQVTRSADSASMTGTNFSSWYRADEGTLYAEGIGSVTSSAVATLINICDNSEGQTERNQLRLRSVGASYVYSANAVAQASITNGAYASTGNKVASVYKVNDFAVSNNSTAVGTDTLGSVGSPVEARFGRLGVIEYLNGTIKKIAYYPKRLTNAEIQSLTVI